MSENPIDLLIAGIGPAGITAALYGKRLGLSTRACGDIPGGNLYMIETLQNFPGFMEGVPGTELGIKMYQQAQLDGAEFNMARLVKLHCVDGQFEGIDANGESHRALTAIIATGRTPERLSLSEDNIKGIHFCSVCDGPLYRGQGAVLVVVGSNNAAARHAVTLSRVAGSVLLIYRSAKAKMDAAHAALLSDIANIEIMPETEVVSFKGNDVLSGLEVSSADGQTREISVNGVFPAIGWRPNNDFIDISIELTSDGYIVTNENLMTSKPGLFAAGDVRRTGLRQVITACGDGALAAKSAAEYICRRHA